MDKKCKDCRDREEQVSFYTEIRIPALWSQCNNVTRGECALRPYLVNNKVFKWFPLDHLLAPDTRDWPTIRDEIDKIYAICAKCQKDNKLQK